MALVKPLVLVSGKVQRLQAGDTLDATVSNPEVITLTVGAGNWVIGAPLYMSAANTGTNAKADAEATSQVIGLAKESATAAATATVITDGVIELTTAQWDAICGTTGGLVYNTPYYLDAGTAGKLTGTAATSGYSVQVIRGISTTVAKIEITPVIKL